MTRRTVCYCLVPLLTACRPKRKPLTNLLPVEIQRMWVLKETHELAVERAPELARSLGVSQALEALYRGNGNIAVTVYEMQTSTSAFELTQKWDHTRAPGFNHGLYFLAVSSADVNGQSVREFAQALRAALR